MAIGGHLLAGKDVTEEFPPREFSTQERKFSRGFICGAYIKFLLTGDAMSDISISLNTNGSRIFTPQKNVK